MRKRTLLGLAALIASCATPQRSPSHAAAPLLPSVAPSPPRAPAAATVAKPGAVGPGTGPPLSLALSVMSERTGRELGLAVPMLLLTVGNRSAEAIEVPQLGVDLIVSLRLAITKATAGGPSELRAATLLRPYTVELAPLAPGAERVQALSPLSVERRDVPLPLGRYQVAVCVSPSNETKYPSLFTDRFGGQCSEPQPIEVARRRREK